LAVQEGATGFPSHSGRSDNEPTTAETGNKVADDNRACEHDLSNRDGTCTDKDGNHYGTRNRNWTGWALDNQTGGIGKDAPVHFMFMAGANAPSGCPKPTTRRCGRKEIADWVDANPGQSVYLKLDNDRAIGCTGCPAVGRAGGLGHHGPG
jgi:hypothetical protein